MKNQLLIGVITSLIAATLLFNYNTTPLSSTLLQFEQFQSNYGKNYGYEQKIYRFSIFVQNLQKIKLHNSDSTQTYTLGITQFADLSPQQFIGKILMHDLNNLHTHFNKINTKSFKNAPTQVDWRDKGVLNGIKNQGSCGSCWAFSVNGALQSNIAVAKKTLVNLSEQQLVDCCGAKGFQCQGCNGAWPEWAFNYINNTGSVLQTEYPYTGRQGTCQNVPTAKKYLNTAKPWTMITGGAIKQSLATTGPVSICVDATNWSLYKSGIFNNCNLTPLNHAVVLVGYQTDDVWIVRNSWGTTWGQSGYIRLAAGNTCGLQTHAIIPNLA